MSLASRSSMSLLRLTIPRVAWILRPKTTSVLNPRSAITRTLSSLRPPSRPRSSSFSSSTLQDLPRSGQQSHASKDEFSASKGDSEPHDPNCICQDPNARLTKATLVHLMDFKNELMADKLGASTDDDLTFVLQYLKEADIPTAEEAFCAHALGAFHAHAALDCLAVFLHRFGPGPVQRVVQAWPDIEAWMTYICAQWIVRGKFIDSHWQDTDHVSGFNGIILCLTQATRIPELVALMLADPRNTMFVITMFCWIIEADEWFMKNEMYIADITAAMPFASLAFARITSGRGVPVGEAPGLDSLKIFEMVRSLQGRTPADTAQTALTLLRRADRDDLTAVCAHLAVLSAIFRTSGTADALRAQHSVRDVTRLLAELSQRPYDAATPPSMTHCISACMAVLAMILPRNEGFGNMRMAVQAGILPALLRCKPWLTPEDSPFGYENAKEILEWVTLYIVYPSVLRPVLVATRKIEELGLVDPTDPIHGLYLNLVHLIAERRALVRPEDGQHIDLHVKCHKCGKPDDEAVFKDCSGCFLFSYCSEACQKEHSEEHKSDCEMAQDMRKEGATLPMMPEDRAYLFQFAMALVNRHRAEIVRVWREEQPARTPLILFDFSQDPNGVLVVGERCLETLPGRTAETGVFVPDINMVVDARLYWSVEWNEVMARPVHDEHALVCMCLPQGQYALGKWMFIGIQEEHEDGHGTVLEKLIKTVEGGFKYGIAPPPVIL
ncbi:hypothetical protein GGX14DRAFT_651838 [Mycena pura]|uniref:MYND-type domain-containing protein n=1 Tax=Mycena pura TaxID=153505 RepID=A0AAD6Y9D8_9AGAR|nr:hypothetical protein GGX14DRAFT_651838 [Mycena pura]